MVLSDLFVNYHCFELFETSNTVFFRMDLMNKGALNLRIDLTSSNSSFKQDPKLVAAINKLYSREEVGPTLKLPERKLLFAEVQQLLKPSLDIIGKKKCNCK